LADQVRGLGDEIALFFDSLDQFSRDFGARSLAHVFCIAGEISSSRT